jgi:hypothetical protein
MRGQEFHFDTARFCNSIREPRPYQREFTAIVVETRAVRATLLIILMFKETAAAHSTFTIAASASHQGIGRNSHATRYPRTVAPSPLLKTIRARKLNS